MCLVEEQRSRELSCRGPPGVSAAGLPPEPLRLPEKNLWIPWFSRDRTGAALGVPELHVPMVTASYDVLLHASPLPFLI